MFCFFKVNWWNNLIFSMLIQIHLHCQKNGYGQSGLWTLKFTVSQEWTDGINWFFACWYKFMQIKRWLKILEVSLIKNGCGQSYERTLKLTVWRINRWNKLIFCILININKNQKLTKNLLCGRGKKWVWPVWSWNSKIDYLKFEQME